LIRERRIKLGLDQISLAKKAGASLKKARFALANGREMGAALYRNARLSLVYTDTWKQDQGSYPLSLSMPLAAGEHGSLENRSVSVGIVAGQPPDSRKLGSRMARLLEQDRWGIPSGRLPPASGMATSHPIISTLARRMKSRARLCKARLEKASAR